ncbi:aspartate kinase [uncultured Dokdonia sp.]|uniref:aspartate kinase n=1 Tax=uncultured Dokdonia sp. TaxID=575653 RepID=UPI00262BE07A|nr:aspartate kinase [uncultured Dokdonia sp.]
MRVLKFGGTSVGSVENMIQVKDIINDQEKKIVVLSAMSGTTNALVTISEYIKTRDTAKASARIDALEVSYVHTIQSLFTNEEVLYDVQEYVQDIFYYLRATTAKTYDQFIYNTVVSYGELLSTYIFSAYLRQEGIKVQLLPALDFMRIDRNNEPDNFYIRQNIHRIIDELPAANIYITQGFICLDVDGEVSNLQRGGSDYTATIIGAAIRAEEVQIWTDIDGFHNNDPRFVDTTTPISNLSFDEAAELAYFGAKILHPQTVMPVRELDIPVRLKNTMAPTSHGTLITNKVHGEGIKAIAAKDGITAIKIKSGRMLLAHGFLKKVFEIFERYETAIDMITTSEIAVSLTIDDATHLVPIVEELERFSFVEVDQQQSIVCLVGNSIIYHHQTHKLFQILQDVPIRMISYGGSHNNISLLIHSDHKVATLQRLHTYLFDNVTA